MFIRPIAYFDPGGATGTVTTPQSSAPVAADSTPTATPSGTPPTPAPETRAVVTPPRDEKGRFSSEAIHKAAGVPMPSESSLTPPSPPAEATPAVATVDAPTLEADLARLDEVIAKATPASPQAQQQTPAPTPQAPATTEVGQLQQWAQNPEIARAVVDSATGYVRMNNALANGKVDDFLGMLTPDMKTALTEHIFRSDFERYAQRFVDEKEGKVSQDPRIAMLERRLSAYENNVQTQEQARIQAQQAAQQQQAQQQLTANFTANMDRLFAAVRLTDPDQRDWLESRIMRQVFSNPKTAAEIRNGHFASVDSKFRELYPKFRAALNASLAQPQQAAQPAATQLMTAASGAPSAPATPQNDLVTSEGRLSGRAMVARLKDYMKKTG